MNTTETYKEFLNRINSFEREELNFGDKGFKVNTQLAQKVNEDNSFKNFYGDTVVFELNESVKNKLAEYVDLLYKSAPQCFCEKLNPNTFHITLHDLSNSTNFSSVKKEIHENALKLKANAEKFYGDTEIKFKSKYIFNMVNTSLVLGLYPAEENDYLNLMQAYSVLDDVKKLNYPFTPHITLAYFNINGFDLRSAKILADAVNRLNKEISLEFTVSKLFYQKFTSMNDYTVILNL